MHLPTALQPPKPLPMEIARLLAGPAAVSLSFLLAARQVEPVASHFYLFAWYGLILTCDQWVRRLEGRSLICRCGPGFGLLMLWSAAAWFFFEFVNFRLENWYYVLVTDRDWMRAAGVFLAFATVFPGIFWIAHLLGCTGFPRSIRGPAMPMTPLRLELLQIAGAGCLQLAFWFPRYCFPLVWVFAVAAVAPVNYRRGIDGLLRQLEAGEYAPTLRMLLAGLIAGGFWELFNFWSRARWIYTVPFFEELKLFEMPLAGFLGFPPFAVECACLYRLLVWHRLAPAFGEFSGQQPLANRPFFLPLAAAVALLFSAAVYMEVDKRTITSLTPRVQRVEALEPEMRSALREAGVRYLTQLEGFGSDRHWQAIAGILGDREVADLKRTAGLYLHQGIGVRWGNLLHRAGIRSLDDLRRLDAEEVLERLRAAAREDDRLPRPAQIRVWLRRLSPAPQEPGITLPY